MYNRQYLTTYIDNCYCKHRIFEGLKRDKRHISPLIKHYNLNYKERDLNITGREKTVNWEHLYQP